MKNVQIALSVLMFLTLATAPATIAKHASKKGAPAEASQTEVKKESGKPETTGGTAEIKPGKSGKSEAKTGADESEKSEAKRSQSGKQESKKEAKSSAAESAKAGDDKEHEGMVFVKGYTKKDGTKVEGYWRKKANTK